MKNYIREALKQGHLNMDLISDALENLKARSYHHQLNSQLEDVKFERYDVDMSEFKYRVIDPTATVIRKRYVAYVEFDTISNAKKLRYKRSDLYRKEISLFDVQKRRDLFEYNYLAFVDGRLVDFINIIPSDTGTQLVFNRQNGMDKYGIEKPEFDEMMKSGKMLSIFFLPNNIYGAYTLDSATLNKYSNFLSLKDMGLANNLQDEASYISFINSNDLGFSSQLLITEKHQDMIKFSDVPSRNKAHINVFGFKYLYKMVDIPVGQTSFHIDYTKMPIPVQNIIPFEVNPDGTHVFAHNVSIKKQYPDMYNISGRSGKPLMVMVFYNTNIDSLVPNYINEIGVYLEHKQHDNLSPLALSFEPREFVYSINDFKNSEYYPNHDEYKLAKFTDWYVYNREYLRDYLAEYLLDSSGFYIDLAEVDIPDRIRWNNHDEIDDPYLQETFDEERLVVILRNEEAGNLKARIYIDGLIYKPDKVYKKGKYEYFYIPTSLITPTSIIDIERYTTGVERFNFTTSQDTDYTKVKFSKNILVAPDDVVVTKEDGTILSKDLYEFYYPTKDGGVVEKDKMTAQSARVDYLYFFVKDISLRDTKFTLNLMKNFDIYEYNIEGLIEQQRTFEIDGGKNPSRYRIFVYYNRRLVQPELYTVKGKGDKLSDKISISLKGFIFKPGDNILIYRIPVSYTKVIYDRNIPENGILDFRGRIKLPFDLKWYDTFINGRFVDYRNINIISPNIVGLNNVYSNRNLLVLSKNDFSLGLFDKETSIIMDKLFDDDVTFREILESIHELDDVFPEEDFLKDTLILFLYQLQDFFNNELLDKIRFINPDLHQFTPRMAKVYPDLITNSKATSPLDGSEINVVMINPDTNVVNAEEVFLISPELTTPVDESQLYKTTDRERIPFPDFEPKKY